ncbi:MAG: hypothetical protein R3B70_35040 [Polyangiaceae bacterium]
MARRTVLFLSIPLLLSTPLLGGCSEPDPTWDLPCEQRPAREVIPGTGEGSFETADDRELKQVFGSQGGSHIWVGVRVRGFGQSPVVTFGILDAEDPSIEFSGPNTEIAELHYNKGEDASEASGMYGFLPGYDPETQMDLPSISGRKVVLWADVSDECSSEAVHGETLSQVE